MRAAVLLLTGAPGHPACPPGVDQVRFGRALAEDVVDLLATLSDVDTLIAATPSRLDDVAAIRWPGTVVLRLSEVDGVVSLLGRIAGYDEAAVFAPDVPDLPALLAAKPFSGLSTAEVAVLPASTGGLVALASRLPVPGWLPSTVDLDDPAALDRLRAAAPRPDDVVVAPAWPRLRTPTDLVRLDPALEGWEATRALVSDS
ncbi:MAG TPA: hypothetical protein VLJ59_20050 [Mycobacteriales bacterium]|nr:hypothetical protein [Mycobacteriales bacterium]